MSSINSLGAYGSINTAWGTQTARVSNTNVSAETTGTTESAIAQDSYQSTAGEQVYEQDTSLVDGLKAELAEQQNRMLATVRDMLKQQGIAVAEGEGIWKQLADGNFEVDEKTRAAAQESISEDGYWGVEKTAERLLKYAKALTGGDPEKAEAMRTAVKKGFEQATAAWGKALPEISQKTYDRTMEMFDDWAKEGKSALQKAVS